MRRVWLNGGFSARLRGFRTITAFLMLVPGIAGTRFSARSTGCSGAGTGQEFHIILTSTRKPPRAESRIAAIGSFDNLNNFTIGYSAAAGRFMIYDSWMDKSLMSPAGLRAIAETVSHPGGLFFRHFCLRKEGAHDLRPVRAEDVAFR